MTVKIAINGFGRIGRAFFRQAEKENAFQIAAINDLASPACLAHLLKYDSVHGRFPGKVRAEIDRIVVNDREIPVFNVSQPRDLHWDRLGIWAVVEATGRLTRRADLEAHRAAGAEKVVLSANPCREDRNRIKAFVLGVNHADYRPASDHCLSNASCTTHCLAPVLMILDRHFGVRGGLVTTIHSYTRDQRLVDSPHEDLGRSRAAAVNMVPTTTGATEAIGLVLPGLEGRLQGLSVRVPTPNVSLADLNVVLDKTTGAKEINDLMGRYATGELRGILDLNVDPVVSMDFNGSTASATMDTLRTMVVDLNGEPGHLAKIMLWYDNETGYAARLVDLLKFMITLEKEEEHGNQIR
ncbi:MAG: aldehyde dehydrogenase [Myxococcales bacterium]|nr:aldehyde dehydrogenase [Myxococcales bacterium]